QRLNLGLAPFIETEWTNIQLLRGGGDCSDEARPDVQSWELPRFLQFINAQFLGPIGLKVCSVNRQGQWYKLSDVYRGKFGGPGQPRIDDDANSGADVGSVVFNPL